MEWYDFLNPHEQDEFECSECGTPMAEDNRYCSGSCFEASMR
jgi:predicted nucleic acid-binding Zn ribbon protein